MTAIGLHREIEPASSPQPAISPSFMVSEFRRRLFCSVFVTDKQLATFMGRPPTLSRRYATCKLPLDLSDSELMADHDALERSKNLLDINGWNTSGAIYPSTIVRAWMLMSLVRDEILELSLGQPMEGYEAEQRRE